MKTWIYCRLRQDTPSEQLKRKGTQSSVCTFYSLFPLYLHRSALICCIFKINIAEIIRKYTVFCLMDIEVGYWMQYRHYEVRTFAGREP